MNWTAPKVRKTSDHEIRMRRGWEGSSRALDRRIASQDKRAGRFFAYLYKSHDGRWIKNGEIFGRNLVEAFRKAKAMRRDWNATGSFRIVFDHYGCTI